MRPRLTVALLAAALAASGCSMLQGKKIDYKSAGSLPSLETPPDLLLPNADNRYAIPEASKASPTTYSDYDRERAGKPATTKAATVLPSVENTRIERAGGQRWLVVGRPATEIWPLVKDFWQEMGFIVNVEVPDAGVMETDWAENRAKIPMDGLRSFLGKALDSFYSTAERDKFRTRLEPAADGRGTEIYISHRGMYEVFEGTQGGGDQGQGRTVWQPRKSDPELEAEMLRRLMVRFGVEETRAQTLLAQGPQTTQGALGKATDGAPGLTLPESFDRAWRRVGLALDRVGFAVEDRDRVAGVYFVRYIDPEAEAKTKKGLLLKLAFWRGDEDKPKSQRYRVKVTPIAEGNTQVAVYREDASPAADETGNRISKLLFEQLK